MSDTGGSGVVRLNRIRDNTIRRIDELVKSNKELDQDWRNFFSDTMEHDISFVERHGEGIVHRLFKNRVSCDVFRLFVNRFNLIDYNEVFRRIMSDRIENRCIRRGEMILYSENTLMDEYLEVIWSQGDFDLMHYEEEEIGSSRVQIYENLMEMISVGELNFAIRYLLAEHPGVFGQLANLIQHEHIARHFFSFSIYGADYRMRHWHITPCEMLVYFDHSVTQASSVIYTLISHECLTPRSRTIYGLPMIFNCLFSKFDPTHRPRKQQVAHIDFFTRTTHGTKQNFTYYVRHNHFDLCNLVILMAQLNFFLQKSEDFFLVRGILPRENYAGYMDFYHEIEGTAREQYHRANLFELIKSCRDEIQQQHQKITLDYQLPAVRRFIRTTVYFIRLAKLLEFCKRETRYSLFVPSEPELSAQLEIKKRHSFKNPTNEEEAKLVLKSVGMRFFLLKSEEGADDQRAARRSRT